MIASAGAPTALFPGQAELATVIHVLITSRSDRSQAFYLGLPSKTVQKL